MFYVVSLLFFYFFAFPALGADVDKSLARIFVKVSSERQREVVGHERLAKQ